MCHQTDVHHISKHLASERTQTMFSFFEKLINPFPNSPAGQPPNTLLAFCWLYSKDIWPFLAILSVLAAVVSVLEIMLFGFLANIVDWLSSVDKSTFLEQESGQLIFMALVILVFIPFISGLHALLLHQSVMGNYPMRFRSLGHRF